jgi:hypothetical protein
MSDAFENQICIVENEKWLSVKFRDFLDSDYLENIVTYVSDRTYEILTSHRTTIEQIEDILIWIKNWHL